MKILTIIVTYNGMQWIERCLGSLQGSSLPTVAYVIDNGSTDGTQEYVQTHFPDAIFVQNSSNEGFGRANNRGIVYALENGYDYVYLLNEDAWLKSDTLSSLISASQRHPEYGVLSPAQTQADGETLDANFRKGPCCQNVQLKADMESGEYSEVYEVETVMAAHWLIPVSTIRKVGVFSPTFPHYGEDDNYLERVRFWGLKAGVVMAATGIHDRQNREEPVSKLLYLHYIQLLKLFSNPSLSYGRALYRSVGDTVKAVWRYKSLRPLSNVFRLLGSWTSVRKNRVQSMTIEGAFIGR